LNDFTFHECSCLDFFSELSKASLLQCHHRSFLVVKKNSLTIRSVSLASSRALLIPLNFGSWSRTSLVGGEVTVLYTLSMNLCSARSSSHPKWSIYFYPNSIRCLNRLSFRASSRAISWENSLILLSVTFSASSLWNLFPFSSIFKETSSNS
jgi:hypothetical protein